MLTTVLALTGCSSTNRLEVQDQFPIPMIEKSPVRLGVLLDDDLLSYVHEETIENKGSWEVSLGVAQQSLFNNLAIGVFEEFEFVDKQSAEHLDGVLQPHISEVQFSLPDQTRSDYYEVWIRYQFKLFDAAGTMIGEWTLPAYGKAKRKDYGSKNTGMQAAAIAACRDAMAFFSINFAREKVVYDWINAGKPLQPPPQLPNPAPTTQAATDSSGADNPAAPAKNTDDSVTRLVGSAQ
jgi:hypothetical protein